MGWVSPQELRNIEAGASLRRLGVLKGEYAGKAIYAPSRYVRNTVKLTTITED